MQVVVACPHCRGTLQLDTAWAGQVMACPLCQRQFIAPPAPASPQPVPQPTTQPYSTMPPHLLTVASAAPPTPQIDEQPSEFDFTRNTGNSGRGSTTSVNRRRKKNSNTGFWAAGGGIGITILAVVLRLTSAGVNSTVYYSDCNEAKEVAYYRYSELGPSAQIKNAVNRHHDECVRYATKGGGVRHSLNAEKYFAEMDRRMTRGY